MNDAVLNTKKVQTSDCFSYRCCRCGKCCQHVRQSVALETLDVYRITRYLRERNSDITCTEDFLVQYGEMVLLDGSGFCVYMLRVQGKEDGCVFLEKNRCMIQAVKPRVCRMYPLVAEPGGDGQFGYLLSLEHPHHFNGRQISVRQWAKRYFDLEERDFLTMEFRAVPRIGSLLRKVPKERMQRAIAVFLFYRYFDFDLEHPFLEQYAANLTKLQMELARLIESYN